MRGGGVPGDRVSGGGSRVPRESNVLVLSVLSSVMTGELGSRLETQPGEACGLFVKCNERAMWKCSLVRIIIMQRQLVLLLEGYN